jgi:hypothetical protein
MPGITKLRAWFDQCKEACDAVRGNKDDARNIGGCRGKCPPGCQMSRAECEREHQRYLVWDALCSAQARCLSWHCAVIYGIVNSETNDYNEKHLKGHETQLMQCKTVHYKCLENLSKYCRQYNMGPPDANGAVVRAFSAIPALCARRRQRGQMGPGVL